MRSLSPSSKSSKQMQHVSKGSPFLNLWIGSFFKADFGKRWRRLRLKSKLIFFRFSLYNPLYIFDFPEQSKNSGVVPWFLLGYAYIDTHHGKTSCTPWFFTKSIFRHALIPNPHPLSKSPTPFSITNPPSKILIPYPSSNPKSHNPITQFIS